MACVDFAREWSELSVRGGAHSVPGFGTNDDGLVIDLAPMNGVRVDPSTRTVRVERLHMGRVQPATYAFGLATTGGIIASTGIAGSRSVAESVTSRGASA
jgi:FAD/FMN-containing dehydrogenase